MDIKEFFKSVEEHDELKGVGMDYDQKQNEGKFAIEHKSSKFVTIIPAGAVEKSDWSLLEDVLTCKREPQILYHMTRVVGYYSRVENWNKSKLGELKDRQSGNYAVTA
jgi:hypothetical protein